MTNKNFHLQKWISQILWEILGSILVAAAICNFAVPANFPMTGFSGISLILYRLYQIPIGLSTIILNLPVAVICYRILGKHFFLSSLRCMFFSSVMIDYIAPLFPVYQGDRLLAALCTGVIAGLGYGLIYMRNSSTGGADFIILAIKHYKPYLSLGKIALLIDMGIVLTGGILFQDIDGMIYGIIVSFLIATVIDKLMYGINAGKMTLIVTSQGQKVCDIIDNCVKRGSTILKGHGGYSGKEREVVLCACNNKEMYLVQQAIKKEVSDAFLIVLESNEVHGQGFRTLQIGGTKQEL